MAEENREHEGVDANDGTNGALVVAENVHKSFGRLEVLKGIDLEVRRGEVMCIIGPSGSGKSTFLRCVNHLEKLSAGRLWVNGELMGYRQKRGKLYELRDSEISAQRSDIGMVFQRFNLFPHLTVLGNIIEAPTQVKRVPKAEATELAMSLLERVGLPDKANSYPEQLSGGQQQRVAIARALASSPQIILFDEPTSALDPEMIGEVLQVMKTLAHSGITMLVVTHEMQFAREIADRVVFIDGGDILEVAPPAEFFAHPQHARARRFLQKVLDPLHQESLE